MKTKIIIITLLTTALLWSLPTPIHATTTVTLNKSVPMEQLRDDGTVSGVAAAVPGASYTVVQFIPTGSDGAPEIVVADAKGAKYRIAASATDYTAPTPVAPVAIASVPLQSPATNAVPLTSPTPAVVPLSSNPIMALAPQRDSTQIDALNALMGVQMFTTSDIWQSPAADLIHRLTATQESSTSTNHGYRSYRPTQVLGITAHSIYVYTQVDPGTQSETPLYISIIFSNLGSTKNPANPQDSDITDLNSAALKDATAIKGALTGLLGNPTDTTINDPAPAYNALPRSDAQSVQRWDSQGTAFLLTHANETYVCLKIMPSSLADKNGVPDSPTQDQTVTILSGRVKHASNGDVTIADVPLTTEGPQMNNYQIPTIWEATLHYYGLFADQMELAQTGVSVANFSATPDDSKGITPYLKVLLRVHHLKLVTTRTDLTSLDQIKPLIDKGIPVLWTSFWSYEIEHQSLVNYDHRKAVIDWTKYTSDLAAQAKTATKPDVDNSFTVPRIILGYNATTNEIEIAGCQSIPDATPRWIYLPTAEIINYGTIQYLEGE